MNRLSLFILFISFSLLVNGENIVDEFINSSAMKDAVAGISVVNLSNGEIVECYNESLPLVPASTLKLLVTASALKCYPFDKTFETVVSYCGEIKGDSLIGDIYVTGCGDPTLGSTYGKQRHDAIFSGIVNVLRVNGIRDISGRIVADDSNFSYQGVSPTWMMEDIGNYFAAGSYGINFCDNRYSLLLRTDKDGKKPVIIGCNPLIPDVKFTNYLTTKGDGNGSAYITGIPFSDCRILSGYVPHGRERYVIKGDIPDPAMFFADTLKEYLRKNGVKCFGGATTVRLLLLSEKPICKGLKHLYSHKSDKLADIINVTNNISNNMYAETLLRWVALAKGKEASADGGIAAVKEIWRETGADLSGIWMYDGNGLSPKNRISPEKLSEILSAAANDKSVAAYFSASIPQTAKEGTVRNFMTGSPIAHKLRLKSGSMEGVQCYAGYFYGKESYAVVVMVNGFTANRSDVQRVIEHLLYGIFKNR
ncbi:MAG: D-alanyl-D-alanine carboxypeptidase/D-alanyl-D-alanine-endopeptidase [Bacteroidales bacterium]